MLPDAWTPEQLEDALAGLAPLFRYATDDELGEYVPVSRRPYPACAECRSALLTEVGARGGAQHCSDCKRIVSVVTVTASDDI